MSELIEAYNFADKLGCYYKSGDVAFVVLRDLLISRGFYNIENTDRGPVAWLNGVRLELVQ